MAALPDDPHKGGAELNQDLTVQRIVVGVDGSTGSLAALRWAEREAALAELGRSDEARTALMEAIRINPFDPDPHCRLAKLAQSGTDQRIEREACDTLRGL